MEDGAVVEAFRTFLPGARMAPLALALGQLYEVRDRFGCFFLKQSADDCAFAGMEDCVSAGLTGHDLCPLNKIRLEQLSNFRIDG